MKNMNFNRFVRDIALSLRYPPKILFKILVNINFPLRYRIKYYTFYRKYIVKEIKPVLMKTVNVIKKDKVHRYNNNNGPIWIFWWQGIEQMPLIVKCCIQSIKKHANGHKIILLNKNNIHKYTNIPKYIYIKLYHHNMNITHFSDIVRFNLLYNHGGLWLDSTIFCTSNLSDEYFTDIYTCGGYNFEQSGKLLCSKWTEFLIGGCKHNKLFQFMDTFFRLYWKTHRYLAEYLLADYVLSYAYKHKIDEKFTEYVDNKAYKNNPQLYNLVDCLNDKYSTKKFKQVTDNTNLFKLTYKSNFNSNGDTFYNRLIHNKL